MPRTTTQRPSRTLSPAGSGMSFLSVWTVGMLVIFVAAIAVLVFVAVDYDDLTLQTFRELLTLRETRAAIRLSAVTSGVTLALVILFCVPVGYALSRCRFRGHSVVETIVDLPIVMPPVVIGVILLIFFSTRVGRAATRAGFDPHSAMGIVLCQFLVSASYAIRASKSAFDAVDRALEHVALTLGCTQWGAFWRVSLPMASGGIVAGCIMAWARAVGVFGPLMVFVGSMRMKTEVMPTTVYLELTIGRIEVALAVSMLMMAAAGVALVIIHGLAGRRRWWGA